MKIKLTILSILITSISLSQSGFEDWDAKYKLIDVKKLIESEKTYAKKVESDTSMAQYYSAMESFRFLGKYTGNKRNVKPKTKSSIKNVLKLRTGKPEIIDDLVSQEIEIKVGDLTFWMPIQNQLIEPFLDEVSVGKDILIYALFTNEHLFNGELINTFLISEFNTEWRK